MTVHKSDFFKILTTGIFCIAGGSGNHAVAVQVSQFSIVFAKNEAQFKAPPKHHFNAKAPHKVWAWSDEKKSLAPIEFKISESSGEAKIQENTLGVKAELYVCDDENTYCTKQSVERSR